MFIASLLVLFTMQQAFKCIHPLYGRSFGRCVCGYAFCHLKMQLSQTSDYEIISLNGLRSHWLLICPHLIILSCLLKCMRTEWQWTQVEWKYTYDMISVPAVIFDRIASKTQKQSSHMLQSEKSYLVISICWWVWWMCLGLKTYYFKSMWLIDSWAWLLTSD